MSEAKRIGLPPKSDAREPDTSPKALWFARGVNLFGLVSPAANLGLVWVAPKDKRWFGLGAGIVCAALVVWGVNSDIRWLVTASLAVHYALVVIGLLNPLWVSGVAKLWLHFGEAIGKVMAYPLFGVVYFLVVTPTGVLLRAFGKDPLARKAPPSETYWTPHGPVAKERYERQF
jgi:Saxitoxin biosynthesis operon protein SxtJ